MNDPMEGASFNNFDAYLFDLDGCLYAGSKLLPGAAPLIATLRRLGKKVAFVSNNSTNDAVAVADKLRSLGIPAAAADVIVPADFIGSYLAEQFGPVSVYPIAAPMVIASLMESGHRVIHDEEESCDVVLVARDIEFSYAKLERASRYVQAGARLVATNTDASHPGEYGYRVPETGALVASIQTVAGEHVRVLGKPEVYLFRKALERLGVPAHRAVMVGDNPRTDVAGARRAGICSVWLNPLGMKVTDNCTPWMECGSLDELLRELRDSQNREDA